MSQCKNSMSALSVLADVAEVAFKEFNSTRNRRASHLENLNASENGSKMPSNLTESTADAKNLNFNGNEQNRPPILKDPTKPYSCGRVECSTACATLSELIDHLMNNHVKKVSGGRYECPACAGRAVFAREIVLRNHILKEHVLFPRRLPAASTGGQTVGNSTSNGGRVPPLILRPNNHLSIKSNNSINPYIATLLIPSPPPIRNLPADSQPELPRTGSLTPLVFTALNDESSFASDKSAVGSTFHSPVETTKIAHQLLEVAQQHHAAEIKNDSTIDGDEEEYKVHHCPKQDCTQTSPNFKMLLKHMIYAHYEADSEKPHVCPYPGCNKSYAGQGGIKYHILNVHADKTSVAKPDIACPRAGCQKVYRTTGGVVYHLENGHHGPYSNAIAINGPPFFCPEGCGIGFLKVQGVELHLWQKHHKRQILKASCNDDDGILADRSEELSDNQQDEGGDLVDDLRKAATVEEGEDLYSTASSLSIHNRNGDENDQRRPNTLFDDDEANLRRKRGRLLKYRSNNSRPLSSLNDGTDYYDSNDSRATSSIIEAAYLLTSIQKQAALASTSSHTNRDQSDSRKGGRTSITTAVRRSARHAKTLQDMDSSNS